MKNYRTILTIGNKNFCAFCGNEITQESNGQLRCQCEDSKQFHNALHVAFQLEMEANKTMNRAPKPKYELRTVCLPISNDDNKIDVEDDEPSIIL